MWKFIKSSTNNSNFLMGHAKEVCFIGRSNVGKSSLINAITNQNKLARTSNTPGRTQLINFFQEDNKMIVDLPGYGFAKMPDNIKKKMFSMIDNYFRTRKELIHTYILLDSKIGPTDLDIDMMMFLQSIEREYSVVFTKIDRTKQSELHKAKQKIKEHEIENIYYVSSKTKKNINALRSDIYTKF